MITQELMDRFFRNECNAEENECLLCHFENNPEEWEQYMNEAEWESFQPNEKLHPVISDKLLHAVKMRAYKRSFIIKKIKWIAAAASVIIIMGIGWNYFIKRSDPLFNPYEQTITKSFIQRELNTTNKKLSIALPDSSVVELYPESEINYAEPFTNNRREIYLKGKAFFKVFKDKTKPFIVYSGGISTTALGTSFTITAFIKKPDITVHLHTGKVEVESTNLINKKHLLPNDVLVYNKRTTVAIVRNTQKSKVSKAVNNKLAKKNTHLAPDSKITAWYMFNNQMLSQVFDQLEELYGIHIIYSKAELKNLYFIGKFEKEDSVEKILNDIALLNNLSVTRHGNNFIINKNTRQKK
jgi:ferric-dicitrate binding protein FerR (iron transport regulator)